MNLEEQNPLIPKIKIPLIGRLKRKPTLSQAKKRVELIKKYSQAMDAIPGLPFGIGLDGIIGLIPGIGDLATMFMSMFIILMIWDLDCPINLIRKMLFNVLIDTSIGMVPILGDAFDIYWKANLMNVKLLEDWMNDNTHLFENDESES